MLGYGNGSKSTGPRCRAIRFLLASGRMRRTTPFYEGENRRCIALAFALALYPSG
jgi:hypothetical protein